MQPKDPVKVAGLGEAEAQCSSPYCIRHLKAKKKKAQCLKLLPTRNAAINVDCRIVQESSNSEFCD